MKIELARQEEAKKLRNGKEKSEALEIVKKVEEEKANKIQENEIKIEVLQEVNKKTDESIELNCKDEGIETLIESSKTNIEGNTNKIKKFSILSVLAWIFGLIYLIGGFVLLTDLNLFRATLAFGIGFLLTPPISEKISNKYELSFKKKIGVTITLIILMKIIKYLNF